MHILQAALLITILKIRREERGIIIAGTNFDVLKKAYLVGLPREVEEI